MKFAEKWGFLRQEKIWQEGIKGHAKALRPIGHLLAVDYADVLDNIFDFEKPIKP